MSELLPTARAFAIASVVLSGCYLSHQVEGPSDDASLDAGLDARSRLDATGDGDSEPALDASRDSAPEPRLDSGPEPEPEPPPPGVRAVQLAAGRDHVCALGDDDSVYCWGHNDVGQSAAGSRVRQPTPSRVRGLPPISSIATMDLHTCAVARTGGLWCWGFSHYDQLGVPESAIPDCGRAECSRVPLQVPDLPPVVQVFVANHGTCARTVDGEVLCWGQDRAVRDVPTDELRGAQTLDFGLGHGCALTSDGVVRCFGDAEFGRIGERDDGIIDLDDVVEVEVGADHACALDEANRVFCWGYDWSGALGVPKTELPTCLHGDTAGECAVTPLQPYRVPPARALSVGAHRTCVIALEGSVACWGAWTVEGTTSWCGGGVEECDSLATPVEGLDETVAIETGASVACAIDGEGAVYCWGWGDFGQLGDGMSTRGLTSVPVRVRGFAE